MPPTLTASPLCHYRDELGEGPVWDQRRGLLLWVDIPAGLVREWDPTSGDEREYRLGGEVSAVAPRAGGGLVVAAGDRLLSLDGETTETLVEIEPGLRSNRTNDCRCDPGGRLWIGTMSRSLTPG
ncbi:MAG TPA: SMP-30/gluconolactonase/LRE family protein, partial [Solirubrobacterales bacterium]|nr:SMP-30/gluconolactonase/LRE family protein [Solirubrobacterales bacterium]